MDLLLRIGDAFHLAAIMILLCAVVRKRSAAGVSAATQSLFLITFVSRYLDVFHKPLLSYLSIMKVTFTGLTLGTLFAVYVAFRSSYDRQNDSCTTVPLSVLVAGAVTYASLDGLWIRHIFVDGCAECFLWMFSKNLETLALIPQLTMIYRNRNVEPTVAVYAVLLGIYRFLYVAAHLEGLLSGIPDDHFARAGLVQCFIIFCLGVPLMLSTKASSKGTNKMRTFRPGTPPRYAKKLSSVYHIECANAAGAKGHSDERKPLIIL